MRKPVCIKQICLSVIVLLVAFSVVKLSSAELPGPSGKIELVFVQGGCFIMGDIQGDGEFDERPAHKVCLDDFSISKFEITVVQWERIMGPNASNKNDEESRPVVNITWQDAQRFIRELSLRDGVIYRLPTEAEWEYAATAGGELVQYATASGKISHDLCNFDGVSEKDIWEKTSPAGSFPPNLLGIFDMCGNVWEWVEDDYDYNAYKKHKRKNPIHRAEVSEKVTRGCGWSDEAEDCRISFRDKIVQDCKHCNRRNDIGFRIVKVP